MSTTAIHDRLQRRIETIPVLPTVAARLMTLDPDGDDYVDEVIELLEYDPAFATRVLSAANSSISSPMMQITSLRMALMRLGVVAAVEAALAVGIARVFVPRHPVEKGLWRHAILVGAAMRALQETCPHTGRTRDEGYLAGLLHDIGHFVLFQEAPDALSLVHEAEWATPDDLLQAERDFCGMTHTEIGALACERWALPDATSVVVKSHHRPNEAPDYLRPLAEMIQFADLMMFPAVLPDVPGYEDAALEAIDVHLAAHQPPEWTLTATDLLQLITDVTSDAQVTFAALGLD